MEKRTLKVVTLIATKAFDVQPFYQEIDTSKFCAVLNLYLAFSSFHAGIRIHEYGKTQHLTVL